MISQPITETSDACKAVAFAACQALITKEVEAVIVPTDSIPSAAAPVAPTDCLQIKIKEEAVTDEVEIVAVPPTKVTVPMELAPAVVVEATLVRIILFPAAVNTRLPLVAVMLPNVAVIEVVAMRDVPAVMVVVDAIVPGAMKVDGVLKVTVWPAFATLI